eukprot:TRINITY_DN33622_c0_g1_i1.p1 TRINITY_DN33622_c0_g1~~TRINITY_DN33622_c0_g1_i1.p1  ORF type:complete len:497 (+),score=84.91 TRINITY_DN33622_c0_g1_i1:84-1574(+)
MWNHASLGLRRLYLGALPAASVASAVTTAQVPDGRRQKRAACNHSTSVVACEAAARQRVVRIEARTLIPGRGSPVADGVVILEGPRIAYAGPATSAPATPTADVFRGEAVMPGMWDCHTHFVGFKDHSRMPIFDELMKTSPVERALRCVGHAAKFLDAGFTSVREVGGMGDAVSAAVEQGSIRGPKVYYAGDILSTTAGHGDMHEFPLESYQACPSKVGHLCDGVPECLRAVRLQLRKGASLIKICASGGVMSKVDHPMHQQFSDEELSAIVNEAHRARVTVAAHCHGKAGIMAALRAGVDSIEHGSYIDDEAIDLMLKQGTTLVPTRFIVETLKRIVGDRKIGDTPPPGLTQEQLNKLIAVQDDHRDNNSRAIRRGVKVAVGCDVFVANDIGYSGRELEYLTNLGMTPLQAIEAATANGAEILGPQAPLSGQLVVGYDADVILLTRNPLEDIGVLGDPKAVSHVWQGGLLVKPVGTTEGPVGKTYAVWDQAVPPA